jgi:hypothetical protein
MEGTEFPMSHLHMCGLDQRGHLYWQQILTTPQLWRGSRVPQNPLHLSPVAPQLGVINGMRIRTGRLLDATIDKRIHSSMWTRLIGRHKAVRLFPPDRPTMLDMYTRGTRVVLIWLDLLTLSTILVTTGLRCSQNGSSITVDINPSMLTIQDILLCFNEIILIHKVVVQGWRNPRTHFCGPVVKYILEKSAPCFPASSYS